MLEDVSFSPPPAPLGGASRSPNWTNADIQNLELIVCALRARGQADATPMDAARWALRAGAAAVQLRALLAAPDAVAFLQSGAVI